MTKLRIFIASTLMAFGMLALPLLATTPVHASAAETIKGGVEEVNDGNDITLQEGIKSVVNMMLFLLGAIAVIMIIIGGIRYATSNGDQAGIKAGKDIVLYAVIGLIVAILAYAIVNFVLDAFTGEG
jgi:hypothetical protein